MTLWADKPPGAIWDGNLRLKDDGTYACRVCGVILMTVTIVELLLKMEELPF